MAQADVAGVATPLQFRDRHWYSNVFSEFKAIAKEPRGGIALFILGTLLVFAYILPIFDTTDPNFIANAPKNQGLSWANPMGTDHLSRDLLARNSIGLGRTIPQRRRRCDRGLVRRHRDRLHRGLARAKTDIIIMRAIDTLLAFPGILLAIVLITILREINVGWDLLPLATAIAIFNVPWVARLARAGCCVSADETTCWPRGPSAVPAAASSSGTWRSTPSDHSPCSSRWPWSRLYSPWPR